MFFLPSILRITWWNCKNTIISVIRNFGLLSKAKCVESRREALHNCFRWYFSISLNVFVLNLFLLVFLAFVFFVYLYQLFTNSNEISLLRCSYATIYLYSILVTMLEFSSWWSSCNDFSQWIVNIPPLGWVMISSVDETRLSDRSTLLLILLILLIL